MEHDYFRTLIELFSKFPGIGFRQAKRFVYFLARADVSFIQDLTTAIVSFKKTIKQCPICFLYHIRESNTCVICSDTNRSTETLIIIEKDIDQHALEEASVTDGRYFVLGGLLPISSPIPSFVRLQKLQERIKKDNPNEIILAFSVHPDANHTATFLMETIKKLTPNVKISILGRGLSTGSELEYSDQLTLKNAFTNRKNTITDL